MVIVAAAVVPNLIFFKGKLHMFQKKFSPAAEKITYHRLSILLLYQPVVQYQLPLIP